MVNVRVCMPVRMHTHMHAHTHAHENESTHADVHHQRYVAVWGARNKRAHAVDARAHRWAIYKMATDETKAEEAWNLFEELTADGKHEGWMNGAYHDRGPLGETPLHVAGLCSARSVLCRCSGGRCSRLLTQATRCNTQPPLHPNSRPLHQSP